jgi:hypothetical protein
MAKIGRNEKCPCRSGKKYKHCCALKEERRSPQPSPEQAMKLTLMSGVKEIQDDAVNRKTVCRELGVFFFYSTAKGDGWLMEMTDCDCVQVARDGVALEPPIDENSETIEINWSHTFGVRSKTLEMTSYSDKNIEQMADAPARELNAAMRRIRKKFTQEQLEKVHLPQSDHDTSP